MAPARGRNRPSQCTRGRAGAEDAPSRAGGRAGQAGTGRYCLSRGSLTGRGGTARGFHPAMVRAHSRAFALSVRPGTAGAAQLWLIARPPLERGAYRCGLGLGDDEHRDSMATLTMTEQAPRFCSWR